MRDLACLLMLLAVLYCLGTWAYITHSNKPRPPWRGGPHGRD